jgi:hypothetical protein
MIRERLLHGDTRIALARGGRKLRILRLLRIENDDRKWTIISKGIAYSYWLSASNALYRYMAG